MEKCKKTLLFLIISIFLILIVILSFKNESQEIIVSNSGKIQYVENIKNTHVYNENLISQVYFNGVPLVYCNNDGFYYYSILDKFDNHIDTISVDSPIKVNYTISNLDYDDLPKYSLNSKKNMDIIIYSDSYYKEISVKFTYLPIISINVNKLINKQKISSKIDIYNPDYINDGGEYYYSLDSQIKTRGSLGMYYPKKSYKFTLNGYQLDGISLFGLKANNEWILDSMYSDPSNVRNVLSSNLWNDIVNLESDSNLKNFLNCRYVEVFINNSYMGLYTLKEQFNDSSLNLDNKILIKGNGYETMKFNPFYISNVFSDNYINFEMKYPLSKENSAPFWYFILNKMKNYYSVYSANDFIMDSSFYTNNIIDYKLLLAFCKAVDNNSIKNVYVEYDILHDKLIYIPWDLDQTFGMTWTSSNSDTYMMYEFDMYDELAVNLKELYSPLFNEKLKDRYIYLRKNVLNYENVDQYLKRYEYLLIESGAAQRDSEKWYPYDIETEFNSIRQWTKNRIVYLDSYFKI